MTTITVQPDKFEELLLYVAKKSQADPRFGATKLNKILFYSDFSVFGFLGKSISGQRYQKLRNGPAPRGLLPLRNRLIENGVCALQEAYYGGRRQHRLIALREPNLSAFSGAEIAIVDSTIEALWEEDGTSVSHLSHKFLGWRAASEGEDIPYETVFASARELTQGESDYALQLEDRGECDGAESPR